jgi:hypothetical protein
MHALAFPIIDTERMTPTSPDGKIGARAWFALAFAVLFAVWLVARLNGYWLR